MDEIDTSKEAVAALATKLADQQKQEIDRLRRLCDERDDYIDKLAAANAEIARMRKANEWLQREAARSQFRVEADFPSPQEPTK